MIGGWHHDPTTLLPVLDDESEFRAVHAGDPALEALVALFDGRPAEAERRLRQLLSRSPDNRRLIALLADARRDRGDVEGAESAYRRLIATERDPLRHATFVQHLGKTLYVAGRFTEAAACFAEALASRREFGAESSLVVSSEVALRAARERST